VSALLRVAPLVLLVACSADGGANAGALDASVDVDGSAVSDGSADARDDATADGSVDARSDGSTIDAGFAQKIALAMYVDPSDPAWAQAKMAAPTVSLLIANPNSGPGTTVDASYTQAIAAAHAVGQIVVGYVHTSYGARPIAQVEADVDTWYALYPSVDGIFSDETSTDPTNVTPYYKPIYDYVKAKSGARVVVINPGTATSESYMQASDIVMSFEDVYANYVNAVTPSWVASYPRARFWHIVLSASQAQMTNAVTLARQRNAGFVYVTDQGPATAYQTFVTGAYWQAELAAVEAP
jgi:hypothetical protein